MTPTQHRLTRALSCVLALLCGVALAKLPTPTPEEQAASAKNAEDKEAQLLKEQEALRHAQDRVVERYRHDLISHGKTPPKPTPTSETPLKDMPKDVAVPPKSNGPRGGTTQSAEAHSGPLK